MYITSKFNIDIRHLSTKTEIIIGSDIIGHLESLPEIRDKNYSSFLLLADETVFKLYGKNIINSLETIGKPIIKSVIPTGERMKNIEELPEIIKPFLASGFDRNAALVCIGGGVITDLGGFISSILLRGISVIHIPTTLLAQVDAALGGKTGVDFWISRKLMLKNMLGTFKQPDLIITDINLLKSLPKRELKSGLGEIAKYWIGWGTPILPSTPRGWTSIDTSGLMNIVSICQKIKLDLVQRDPFDTFGLREKLNLGHTLGHALEGNANGKLTHGEAVALGLVAAAKISLLQGLLKEDTKNHIIETIKNIGFRTTVRGLNKKNILSAIKHDKKAGRFVLIKDIGHIITRQMVKKDVIKKVLDEIII